MDFTQPYDHFMTENWIYDSTSLNDFLDNLIHDDMFDKKKEKNTNAYDYLKQFQHDSIVFNPVSTILTTSKDVEKKYVILATILTNQPSSYNLFSSKSSDSLLFPIFDLLQAFIIFYCRNLKDDEIKKFIDDMNEKTGIISNNMYQIVKKESKIQIIYNSFFRNSLLNFNERSFDLIEERKKYEKYHFNNDNIILNLYKIISFNESIFNNYTPSSPEDMEKDIEKINLYREMLDELILKFRMNLKYNDKFRIENLFLGLLYEDKVIENFCKWADKEFTFENKILKRTIKTIDILRSDEYETICNDEEQMSNITYDTLPLLYDKIMHCLDFRKTNYKNILIKILDQKTAIFSRSSNYEDLQKIKNELYLWFYIYIVQGINNLELGNKKEYALCLEYLKLPSLTKDRTNQKFLYDNTEVFNPDDVKNIQQFTIDFEKELKNFNTVIIPIAREKKTLFGKLHLLQQLICCLMKIDNFDSYKKIDDPKINEPLSRILQKFDLNKINTVKITEIRKIASFYAQQLKFTALDLEFLNSYMTLLECKENPLEIIKKIGAITGKEDGGKRKVVRKKSRKIKKSNNIK